MIVVTTANSPAVTLNPSQAPTSAPASEPAIPMAFVRAGESPWTQAR
jgi:hypothetical protein